MSGPRGSRSERPRRARAGGGAERRSVAPGTPFRTIGEAFYRSRAELGRDWTLKRMAAELGVDAVFLGYVEQGQRFPGESVVRRLAAVRGEDAAPLLTILLRDRMVRALEREIRRALEDVDAEPDARARAADGPVSGPSSTKVLARALAALPHGGDPVAKSVLATAIRAALVDEGGPGGAREVRAVRARLVEKGLVAESGAQVRKTGRHVVATGAAERVDLALELAAIFAKGLADKLVAGRTDTYLRNHFVSLAKARVPEFRARLDAVLRALVDEFATPPPARGAVSSFQDAEAEEFVRILVTATTQE